MRVRDVEEEEVQTLLDILDSLCTDPIGPYPDYLQGGEVVDVGRCKFCGAIGEIHYTYVHLEHQPTCATVLVAAMRKRREERKKPHDSTATRG